MKDDSERNFICEYKGSVDEFEPVDHRRYTFLKKEDGDKLVVALKFDSRNTDTARNEVLGEWAVSDNKYVLYFHVNIDFDESIQSVAVRNSIARNGLAESIKRILTIDKKLLENKKELFKSSIIIYFKCALPYYNRLENWGTVEDYLSNKDLKVVQYGRREVEIIKLLIKKYIEEKVCNFYDNDEEYKIENIDIFNIESNELIKIYYIDFLVNVTRTQKIQNFIGTIKISGKVLDIIKFEIE